MKKLKITYWTFTLLFAAFMIWTALPDITKEKEAVDFISGFLGYPEYFVPFIGVAKLLGALTLLIPGNARLKEWAYAGLAFDLVGATYSVVMKVTPDASTLFMLVPFVLLALSYIWHHKFLKARKTQREINAQLAL
jgi:uncharacterized membrane protein